MDYLKEKMENRFCKKCNHLCHCIEADHSDCKCENCDCKEPVGMVVDDTQECEMCQWKNYIYY